MNDYHDPQLRTEVYTKAVEMMNAEDLDAVFVQHHYREFQSDGGDGMPAIMSAASAVLVGHYVTRAAIEGHRELFQGDEMVMRFARGVLPLRCDELPISTVYF